MEFSTFTSNLSKLVNSTNGGEEAQFKLAPNMRLKYAVSKFKATSPTKAAVLALFYPNAKNEVCITLTLRADYKGTHSSQISFPGGKYSSIDTSLEDTATRETFEEIGIQTNTISLFKELTQVYIPPSNFLVTPFMGYITYTPSFIPNHEVEKVIEITVNELLTDSCVSTAMVSTSYASSIEVPCFKLDNEIVWGATAMMLSEIRELLKNI